MGKLRRITLHHKELIEGGGKASVEAGRLNGEMVWLMA